MRLGAGHGQHQLRGEVGLPTELLPRSAEYKSFIEDDLWVCCSELDRYERKFKEAFGLVEPEKVLRAVGRGAPGSQLGAGNR